MRVIVHILVWNDRRYLPDLFASLHDQEFQDFVVRVLDNGSTDESVAYLQQHFAHTLVARNVRNAGFAVGHNQLMRFTLDHLPEEEVGNTAVFIMNSDMILDPKCLGTLVGALAADPTLDAVQPKLYRAFGEHLGDETLEETVKSDILDTTGLMVLPHWRMVDRGAGEIDAGQYDRRPEVLPTGACVLYRLSALRDVMLNGELYDADFNTYREDCDLAWRWRAEGHRTQFVPAARAWHYRGMYGAATQGWWQRLRNRQKQRPQFAALGTRNQLFVLLKNLPLGAGLRSLPRLLFHEGGRGLYGLLFEPATRRALLTIPALLPKMLEKRRLLRRRASYRLRPPYGA